MLYGVHLMKHVMHSVAGTELFLSHSGRVGQDGGLLVWGGRIKLSTSSWDGIFMSTSWGSAMLQRVGRGF